MAAGCVVLGSDTPPVQELIQHGKNGLLTDFFSPEQIAEKIDLIFGESDRMAGLGINARATILKKYTIKHSIKNYEHMLKNLGIKLGVK